MFKGADRHSKMFEKEKLVCFASGALSMISYSTDTISYNVKAYLQDYNLLSVHPCSLALH